MIKLGGRAFEGAARSELAQALVALAGPAVLVHGGGAEVTDWCARLGIAASFADGLRVTDPATLEVAVAVLGGLANKRWVAELDDHGVAAAGWCALDGGIARVTPHPDQARLGAVGQVATVDPTFLQLALARGITPVLASIGADHGRLLNVNADDLAAAIAGALATPALFLLSDTPGLLLDGALVTALDPSGLAAALRHPDVQGGMRPKLRAAQLALAQGAAQVWIGAWQGPDTLSRALQGAAGGTTLTRAPVSSSGPDPFTTAPYAPAAAGEAR